MYLCWYILRFVLPPGLLLWAAPNGLLSSCQNIVAGNFTTWSLGVDDLVIFCVGGASGLGTWEHVRGGVVFTIKGGYQIRHCHRCRLVPIDICGAGKERETEKESLRNLY